MHKTVLWKHSCLPKVTLNKLSIRHNIDFQQIPHRSNIISHRKHQTHPIITFPNNRSTLIFKKTWQKVKSLLQRKVCNFSKKRWTGQAWAGKNHPTLPKVHKISNPCKRQLLALTQWKKLSQILLKTYKITNPSRKSILNHLKTSNNNKITIPKTNTNPKVTNHNKRNRSSKKNQFLKKRPQSNKHTKINWKKSRLWGNKLSKKCWKENWEKNKAWKVEQETTAILSVETSPKWKFPNKMNN